jgi:HEAT repeat protein
MKKEVLLSAVVLISAAQIRTTAQTPAPSGGASADGAADVDVSRRRESLSVLATLKDPANEEKARRSLTDEDWYVRGQAAIALARANKAAAKDLLPLLEDKNWFVRSAALEGLGLLRDPSVGPDVQRLLDPSDPYICARAASLLGEINFAPATDSLQKLLAADDDQVKRAAATALGMLKVQAAEDPLTALLKDDSFAVRAAAASALGKLGDHKAESAVETAFNDATQREAPESWEYAAALYRLGNHDHIDAVIAALKSQFADTRAGALRALTEFGDNRAMPALADLSKIPASSDASAVSPDASFRLQLVSALARINETQARAALMTMFSDPDPDIRATAVTGLAASLSQARSSPGFSSSEIDDSMTAMVGLLKSEQSPAVVAALTKSLSLLDRDRAINALLVLVKYGDNITKALSGLGITVDSMSSRLASGELSDRVYAAGVLGRLGDHQSVPALAEALVSAKEPPLRVKAAESLGILADRRGENALVQASQSDNPEVKAAAVTALGRMGDLSVTDTLFDATRDNQESVREAALRSLDVLGISVEKLSSDATSPVWQTRVTAIATLGRLRDPRGVPVVIGALGDKDERVRMESAKTLAVLKDPGAVDPLIAALKDPDSDVRFEAAAALGVYREGRSLAPLTALLNDKDARVSAAAAESLARMNDPRATNLLVGYLGNPDWRLRARAAQVLMRVPEASARAVTPLVVALRDRDLVVRYYAAEALVTVGGPAVPQLVALFSGGTFTERERAARVLARIGHPAVGALSTVAQDKAASPELKAASAHVLGLIGDAQAVPALLSLLSEERYFVREQASFALGRIGQPAIEKLIDMSGSGVPATRQAAVAGLGVACGEVARQARLAPERSPNSADPPEVIRAIGTLLNSMRDSSVAVRTAAAHALGDTGSPRAIEPLIAVLKDESSTLRGEASVALGNLHAVAVPALISALSSDKPSTRKLAAQSLGETGSKEAVPALIRLVTTDVSGARGEAIEALGKLGEASAVDAILSAMATGSAGVKRKSISALVLLHDPRIQDALIRALADKDGESRQAAAEGLGDIGDERAVPSLEKVADKDADPEVRKAAVSAIERLLARSRKTSDQKQ